MAKYIKDKINIDCWSPDVIVDYMKIHNYFEKDGFCNITVPTIYNAIRFGIINGKIVIMKRMKYDPKYEYNELKEVCGSKLPYSIENRSEEVVNKFNQIKSFMKSNYNKIFKSLTTDNGSEFSSFLDIIKDTNTKIYFCHPYCSGEKGNNERNNEIIRYFIPKGKLLL